MNMKRELVEYLRIIDYYNEQIDKFETKLCGHSICNGCYAVALGYSKHHIEELKGNIRSMGIIILELFDEDCKGRLSTIYGNVVHIPITTLDK